MIEVLEKHKNDINEEICEDLIDIINDFNISSKEELLEYENKFFNTDNLLEKLNIKYNSYLRDTTHFDLDIDLSKIKEYIKLYLKEEKELEKAKYLILLLNEIQWELFFPYEAYLLIEDNNL